MNYKYILTAVLIVAVFSGTASAWLSGYGHRMAITVNNGGASELNNYQFNFTNDTNVLVAAGHMQASGADCRITTASDNLLPFWNETPFNAAGTKIWVNATTLAAGDNTFYMYYENAGASSAANGDTTFEFFDDFETGESAYSASRIAGSSMGFNAACSRVVVADNGTWLMIYRARADGSAPSAHEGQVWIRNSTDEGETWSAGTKLSNDAVDAINAEFVKYPNGDIDIFHSRYDNTGGVDHTPNMVARTTNNGSTWSSFVEAPSPLNSEVQTMWQEIIIGNDVYLAASKKNISTLYLWTPLYKTSDNGSTWTWISNITAAPIGSAHVESGLAYLGDGEFVAVLRDINNTHTLQKRSVDWGVTWSIDGYIKNDGSVGASGVGTDVVLQQCRLFNKDIDGNDLGYIYMQAALYPGGYPRDMYAYISTNNCTSWGTVDPIYTASDCHDSAIVFKNTTSAKYYPGKISGESATTADDITISLISVPLSSMWDSRHQQVTLSTDQSFCGSKSANFSTDGLLEKILVHSDDIAVKYWSYFPSQPVTVYPFLHGDSISRTYVVAGYPNVGDISYHDGGWQTTGTSLITGAWKSFETKDFNWTGHTQDILYDESVIASDVGQRSGSDDADTIMVQSDGSEYFYIDCFLVRKYASPEPTSSLGAEEDASSGGGAYNITLPLGWSIIGWTDSTDRTAHYMGGLIGGNCSYVTERNRTTGLYVNHNMAGPESENNFAIERGWGYFVSTTAETLWERDT
jgi:hypothetical protein